LTFDGTDGKRHMLIDCGTLGATTTGVKIKDVVDDILEECDRRLHIVVATHEHQDHLSGFRSCQKDFEGAKVDNVWLAWTENPEDPVALEIAKYKKDIGEALTAVARSPLAAHVAPQLDGLLGFYGDEVLWGAGKFAETVHESMEFVRRGLGAKANYLKPSHATIELDEIPGFRFYVLGPPRDPAALRKTGEHGSSELYHLSAASNAAGLAATALAGLRTLLKAAALEGTPAIDELLKSIADGDTNERFNPDAQETDSLERERPFDASFAKKDTEVWESLPGYFDPNEEWRSIDHDWLNGAADFALQLDNLTNNTSLALAIERKADGKVLLFPADAQEGNWLSWHDPNRTWRVTDPETGFREVTAADLLRRVVFYKVGHHGSHNATLKGDGLELMENESELTAFIPVDRAVALRRNPKGQWKMPARPLYRRLLQKCQGRVVRSDIGWAVRPLDADQRETEREFDRLVTNDQWGKWKTEQAQQKRVKINDLFVEYALDGAD